MVKRGLEGACNLALIGKGNDATQLSRAIEEQADGHPEVTVILKIHIWLSSSQRDMEKLRPEGSIFHCDRGLPKWAGCLLIPDTPAMPIFHSIPAPYFEAQVANVHSLLLNLNFYLLESKATSKL